MDTLALYQPRKTNIGLTALIDVVFILLMFFMLTSSFSHWRAIELNAPLQAPQVDTHKPPQLLVLYPDHSVELHGTHFRLAHIADVLTADLTQLTANEALVVIPHADTQVEAITQLLGHLTQRGFTRTTLGGLLPEHHEPVIEEKADQ